MAATHAAHIPPRAIAVPRGQLSDRTQTPANKALTPEAAVSTDDLRAGLLGREAELGDRSVREQRQDVVHTAAEHDQRQADGRHRQRSLRRSDLDRDGLLQCGPQEAILDESQRIIDRRMGVAGDRVPHPEELEHALRIAADSLRQACEQSLLIDLSQVCGQRLERAVQPRSGRCRH